ncbi:MAG: CapA family protein [Blastocatellia bacterium]|nr:CapA family protein [Blastocatellia bacterium]
MKHTRSNLPSKGSQRWKAGLPALFLASFFFLFGCSSQPPVRAVFPKLELWFGGDVHLGTTSAKNILTRLKPMTDGRIGFVNLEGAIAESPSGKNGLKLVNSESNLNNLHEAGVELVGIANNHALDNGPNSLEQTAAVLKKIGFHPIGGPAGAAILERAGMKLVFTAHDLTGGIPPKLEEELAAARKQGDLLVATFHVTGPASYLPRPELKQAAQVAIGAGASVVVAHGTHAIGPVERKGQTAIAWGLGNLAFNCDCTAETEAVLLLATVENKQVTKTAIYPVTAGLHGKPALSAQNPNGTFDLLEAVGSPTLQRQGSLAVLF